MYKLFLLAILFIKFSLGYVYAEDEYKIILKIDKKIITNFDIQKETEYLLALNPNLSKLSAVQLKKVSKQSLKREVIKENQILKFYSIDYDAPGVTELTKSLYSRLNINTEQEFDEYLLKFNLDLKDVGRKLIIEKTWNQLIYERYKDQLNIDEEKIRKTLSDNLFGLETQTNFLISEILLNPKSQLELNNDYNNIKKLINEKGFKIAASIHSISNTGKNGGEIGWVNKNEVSNLIYKELSNLKINEFSAPIKIASGFLIIYLNDLREEKIEINQEDELLRIIAIEKNRQLNQYSNIYYKKIEMQTFVNEE